MDQLLEVRAWGEFACFTRPEMKVERVSYPVMTPSAARGLLEGIFWKPEFRWRVREIWVLSPIRFMSLLRNEVKTKAAVTSIQKWGPNDGYFAEEDRAQRHTLMLRQVDYLIRADIAVRPGVGDPPAKYRAQFERRVSRGARAYSPYFGCRECTAAFGPRRGDEQPISVSSDLGRMLFDLDYTATGDGRGVPLFFDARLELGILRVPAQLYGGDG